MGNLLIPFRTELAAVKLELMRAVVKVSPDASPLWERALKSLATMQKNKRPRKRKGLVAYLHSHFSNKVSEAELRGIVDQLIAAKKLSEVNGAIAYHF